MKITAVSDKFFENKELPETYLYFINTHNPKTSVSHNLQM